MALLSWPRLLRRRRLVCVFNAIPFESAQFASISLRGSERESGCPCRVASASRMRDMAVLMFTLDITGRRIRCALLRPGGAPIQLDGDGDLGWFA